MCVCVFRMQVSGVWLLSKRIGRGAFGDIFSARSLIDPSLKVSRARVSRAVGWDPTCTESGNRLCTRMHACMQKKTRKEEERTHATLIATKRGVNNNNNYNNNIQAKLVACAGGPQGRNMLRATARRARRGGPGATQPAAERGRSPSETAGLPLRVSGFCSVCSLFFFFFFFFEGWREVG